MTSSRVDFHLQDRAHAGRTKERPALLRVLNDDDNDLNVRPHRLPMCSTKLSYVVVQHCGSLLRLSNASTVDSCTLLPLCCVVTVQKKAPPVKAALVR